MSIVTPMTALVAEDDKLTQYAMKLMLTEMDFAVTIADSCATAQQCIKEQVYEIYFLDIGLPGDGNGLQLYSLIKDTHPESHAFIASAITKELFITKYPHINPDHFVEKPILKKVLVDLLESIALTA